MEEVDDLGLLIQGHPQLYIEFQASPGYLRLGFKAEREETTTKLQSDQHNRQGFRPLPVEALSTQQHPCEWLLSRRQFPEHLYF